MDLALALDGAAMAGELGSQRCEPRYVRFQPGRRLLVLYELDGALAHLTFLRPNRIERLWERVEGSPLASRVLGGVLQRFPLDVRLPGLPEAARGGVLIRYKPGRRALFRYPDAYGKLRADGRTSTALARALIAQGIRTPAPLGERNGTAVYEEVPGERLRDTDRRPWMAPVAEALRRLHAARVEGLPAHSMAAEIEDLRAAAETATTLGVAADDLAEALAPLLMSVEPKAATIHGSFHDDQVLVGEGGVTLLDLDSAALGHPLLDVGHFAAYLTAAGEEEARAAFLEAYGCDALLFEAAALLRWSSLPFRDLEPGWREAVAQRVELAQFRFDDYRRSASSVITAS